MKKLALLPLGMALLLAACSGEAESGEGITSSEPIEAIAAPEGQSWSTTVTPTETGGFVMGNPEAPIKLVEYMSITCNVCARFSEQAFDSIQKDYIESGRVSFEIRNYVRDPLDLTAAILSRCGGEGPYFALTKQVMGQQGAMFEKAQAMGEATYNDILQSPADQRFVRLGEKLDLINFFKQRGISEDQAKACLADTAVAEKLMKDTQTAFDERNVAGTPTFLLNGQKFEGTTWAVVETKLQEAGAR